MLGFSYSHRLGVDELEALPVDLYIGFKWLFFLLVEVEQKGAFSLEKSSGMSLFDLLEALLNGAAELDELDHSVIVLLVLKHAFF